MKRQHDVVIVGGGPVGLGLAVELGQRGVDCLLVERHTDVSKIPKGQNLTPRTLEHFRAWRCCDELRSRRVLPIGFPIGNATLYRSLLSDYWYSAPGHETVERYYAEKAERLPQFLTEEVLRERLLQLESVTTLFGHRVVSMCETDEEVSVTARSVHSGGEEVSIRARFLVGCDGSKSSVRRFLGINREGPDFNQTMSLVVFRSTRLNRLIQRLGPHTTFRVLKPESQGVWHFFGRVDADEQWFFHAPVDTQPDGTVDPARAAAAISDAAGTEVDCRIEYLGTWDLRIDVAARYSSGRCFIAGDAAHRHPPYGGFGLNSGLEDIVNLGWKLAAVVGGWGGPGLLSSYDSERRPIFAETGTEVIAKGIRDDAAMLAQCTPEADPVAFREAWDRLAAKRSPTGYEPHYEGSPIIPGSKGQPGVRGVHSIAALPGHHLAPRTLGSGKNTFDELGTGFTLLDLGASREVVEKFRVVATAAGIPVAVVHDHGGGDTGDYQATLVLVRPDQYVAWVGREECGSDPRRSRIEQLSHDAVRSTLLSCVGGR